MARRITAAALRARKGKPFPLVTVYDAAFARLAEQAGIDCVLVGDSLGMVVLGYEATLSVTLDDMCRHTAAVARGSEKLHIIGDLPFGSYEASDTDAVFSAAALIRAGAQSVKLEGGRKRASRIRAIADAGIPVVAHLGVLPQTAGLDEGFKRRHDRDDLLADAQAVTEAGAFACVLEMVAADLAAEISARIAIPTIGIGSGTACDAQILVMHDILGLSENPPPFARCYTPLGEQTIAAFQAFAADVRAPR
jgi:3-methyl-2-oxobutanoate hydroxymethyltransferase